MLSLLAIMLLSSVLTDVQPNDALHRITIHVSASDQSMTPVANAEVALWTRAGQVTFTGRTNERGVLVLDRVPGYSADLAVGYHDCPRVRQAFDLLDAEVALKISLPPVASLAVAVRSVSSDGHSRRPVEAAYVTAEYARPQPSVAGLTDSNGSAALCVLANQDFQLRITAEHYCGAARQLRLRAGERGEQSIVLSAGCE